MGEGEVEGRRGASVLRGAFREGLAELSLSLPKHVRQELDAYLRCGDVRHGFMEVSCEGCPESRIVAFSCKGRGWCPSCTNRRAVETGIHVEALLPRVAHRQWTLSLPYSVRFPVVKAPVLLKRLEVWLVKAVWRWQRKEARRLGLKGKLKGGGVCFWQWFNSRLQVAPHLHLVVPETLWTAEGKVVEVPGPSDADVMAILQRVLRMAKKAWLEEGFWADDEYEALQQQAAQRQLPLGDEKAPRPRKPLVAVVDNFSLHAGTLVRGNDREGLERIARYGARGPVAENRLQRLDDGRYHYAPKKGPSLTLTAGELVRKLLALTPPPRRHLTSWHGVFAPNATLRRPLTTPPTASTPPPKPSKKAKPKKRPRIDWASLHQHTFKVDVLKCPHCGGQRRVRAFYDTRAKAEARLAELGLIPDTSPPPLPFPTAPPPFVLAA